MAAVRLRRYLIPISVTDTLGVHATRLRRTTRVSLVRLGSGEHVAASAFAAGSTPRLSLWRTTLRNETCTR